MMYQVTTKYPIYEEEQVTRTVIQINHQHQHGINSITKAIKGNHMQATDDTLIELVLDEFYQENYSSKVNSEALQKTQELAEKIKELEPLKTSTEKIKELTEVINILLGEEQATNE